MIRKLFRARGISLNTSKGGDSYLLMPRYPNGTGNRLKICRLNCLRVRIPSSAPYGRVAQSVRAGDL